ncbi:DNA replication complex GINS protein PSF2 [Cloeon dipterum]|uniref:DNA replication complex GINS protein PSF2 n=1 Tax=Cloeon dipterum TaxID=197152 RepID=A0A8S1CNX4_9INSE|nr:Hypothetical predicted protein [Cloeon dipterum]
MDTCEVEFLAERELISITPNFDLGVLHLISGDFGPFKAGLPAEVPLWLAINLRQRRKCRIMPPIWLNVKTLEEIKERETQEKLFTKMPSEHFMEVAQLLLTAASEDIPQAGEIKVVLKDIWDSRQAKTRASCSLLLQDGGKHARVDNLTLMEINSVRPLLPHSMDMIRRLQMESSMEAQISQTQGSSFASPSQ